MAQFNDEDSPTLLEVISANEFESLINPTLKYLNTLVLYKFHNKTLFAINNNIDEILLVVQTAYNYRLLGTEQGNSTFIKSNYGYKYGSTAHNTPLSTKQRVLLVLENYVLDYLWTKGDLLYEKKTKYLESQTAILERERMMNGDHSNEREPPLDEDIPGFSQLDRKFIQVYPVVKRAYSVTNFVFKLLYLNKSTGALTLAQFLANINMFRMTDTGPAAEEASVSHTPLVSRRKNLNFWTYVRKLVSLAKSNLLPDTSRLFRILLYVIKIMQYYNSTQLVQTIKNRLDDISTIPPPPPLPTPVDSSVDQEADSAKEIHGRDSSDICKLCHSTIVNPAMLETGYVFCYSCIVKYYKESEKLDDEGGAESGTRPKVYCPVSGVPLLHDLNNSIRRLLF